MELARKGREWLPSLAWLGVLIWPLSAANIDTARQYIEQGDYARAERELLETVHAAPQAPDANFLLGIVYTRTARYEKGRWFLLQALEHSPTSVAVLNNLGVNALGRRQVQEAEQYFRRALAVDPNGSDALFNLGLICLNQKRSAEATELLEKANAARPRDLGILQALLAAALQARSADKIRGAAGALMEVGPRTPAFFLELGKAIAGKGQYMAAVELLERARALYPDSAEIGRSLAAAQFLSGNARAARELAEAELKKEERAGLYALLGDVYESLGLYADAANAYRAAVRLDPQNDEYHFNLGYEFVIHHNFDLAENIFRTSLQKFPCAPKLYLGLSAAYFGRVQYREAIEAVIRAIDLAPESPGAYFFLAQALATLAGQDDGIADARVGERLNKYVALCPREAFPHYAYAIYLLARKRVEGGSPTAEVAAQLRKAVELDPRLAEAYLELGKIRSAAGDYRRALEQYERAAGLNPALPQVWYQMGRAYMKLGESERARRAWEKHAEQRKQVEGDAARREKQTLRFLYTLR